VSELTLRTGGRTGFEPGETVDVEAEWQLDAQAEAIELRLLWHTSGKGDTDVSIVETVRWEEPGLFESRRAKIALPEAPYSFSGRLVSLAWALELVVLPGEESQRIDLVLAPAVREVLLHREGDAKPNQ
jgi:hypothetical protein